jgi:hypothetical protein
MGSVGRRIPDGGTAVVQDVRQHVQPCYLQRFGFGYGKKEKNVVCE